jgi:hypothetical protein
MWIVGETARVSSVLGQSGIGMPTDVARAKTQDLGDQMRELRAPWFWMGWLEDPGLSQSGLQEATQTGHYFVEALIDDGPYPTHALFVALERMQHLAYAPGAWNFSARRHFEMQYSALAIKGLLKSIPRTPEFDQLLANSFRMNLFLLMDDLDATKRALRPESQRGQIQFLLTQTKGLTAADRRLAQRALMGLESAARESTR